LLRRQRKFGKQIQKKQLEIPEYAASFVDYKALKKVSILPVPYASPGLSLRARSHKGHAADDSVTTQLIKRLSATPVLASQNDARRPLESVDSRAALQANKATFFFQLVKAPLLGRV